MENAADEENVVRFALPTDSDAKQVTDFVINIVPEAKITESLKNIPNPVLSKLNVNNSDRYQI